MTQHYEFKTENPGTGLRTLKMRAQQAKCEPLSPAVINSFVSVRDAQLPSHNAERHPDTMRELQALS